MAFIQHTKYRSAKISTCTVVRRYRASNVPHISSGVSCLPRESVLPQLSNLLIFHVHRVCSSLNRNCHIRNIWRKLHSTSARWRPKLKLCKQSVRPKTKHPTIRHLLTKHRVGCGGELDTSCYFLRLTKLG